MAKQYKNIHERKEVDHYDLEGSLDGVITTLEEWKTKYGGEAHIEISVDMYGEGIGVELTWIRQETEKERASRLQQAKNIRDHKAQLALDNIAKEKLEYIRLKEMYG